jgi:hypothetical protein
MEFLLGPHRKYGIQQSSLPWECLYRAVAYQQKREEVYQAFAY